MPTGATHDRPIPPRCTGRDIGRATTVAELDPDLLPTRIPHVRLRYGPLRTGIATGAWRAPSHVAIAFAIESTIDALAVLAKRSAIDMRLEILGDAADVPRDPHGANTLRSDAHGARDPGRSGARGVRVPQLRTVAPAGLPRIIRSGRIVHRWWSYR